MIILICLLIIINVIILALIINGIQDIKIKKASVSFKSYLDNVGLPIVQLYQGPKQYNFLLDSGANYSCIRNDVLENMDYIKSDKTNSVYGIEGNTKDVNCVKVKLQSDTQEYEELFQVLDLDAFDLVEKEHNVKISGILGNKFMANNKIIMDFKEYKVYPI